MDEDADVFEALETAAVRREKRWTTEREMLASILETLHALYLLTARANGARNVGKPLRVPRPGDKPKQAMSPGAFARMVRSSSG